MPWVRFDDQYPIHRKVAALSDAAFRLHTSAVFWCARNLTDGCVPEGDLDQVCAQVRKPEKHLPELMRRGLVHEAGYVCDSEECPADGSQADGWVLHDYFEYQFSKKKVVKERKASAERQRAFRDRRKQEPAGQDKEGPQDNGDSNAGSNGVTNGGSNAAPSRPDPARPVSSCGEGGQEPSTSVGGAGGGADADASGATDKQAAATKRTDKGTRLPDDFTVTAEMASWAREKAPTTGWEDHEAFCDYWRAAPGAKGRKRDWVATWRNWMRREHERRSGRGSSAKNVVSIGSRQQQSDDLFDRAMARAKEREAQMGIGDAQ